MKLLRYRYYSEKEGDKKLLKKLDKIGNGEFRTPARIGAAGVGIIGGFPGAAAGTLVGAGIGAYKGKTAKGALVGNLIGGSTTGLLSYAATMNGYKKHVEKQAREDAKILRHGSEKEKEEVRKRHTVKFEKDFPFNKKKKG